MLWIRKFSFLAVALLVLGAAGFAQTKKTARPPKAAKPVPTATATPQPTPEPAATPLSKRNERPTLDAVLGPRGSAAKEIAIRNSDPVYFYEFTRPGFTYSRILIEHDEAGKGKISFQKGEFDEMI